MTDTEWSNRRSDMEAGGVRFSVSEVTEGHFKGQTCMFASLTVIAHSEKPFNECLQEAPRGLISAMRAKLDECEIRLTEKGM